MPIQPTSNASGAGFIEIYPQFSDGLKDLDGFSHIYLLYHFYKVSFLNLTVVSFLDMEPPGIFATRTPAAITQLAFLWSSL